MSASFAISAATAASAASAVATVVSAASSAVAAAEEASAAAAKACKAALASATALASALQERTEECGGEGIVEDDSSTESDAVGAAHTFPPFGVPVAAVGATDVM